MLCYANLYLRTNPLKIFKESPVTFSSTTRNIFFSFVLKKTTGISLNVFKGFVLKYGLGW